jgi:hypothetical protein
VFLEPGPYRRKVVKKFLSRVGYGLMVIPMALTFLGIFSCEVSRSAELCGNLNKNFTVVLVLVIVGVMLAGGSLLVKKKE